MEFAKCSETNPCANSLCWRRSCGIMVLTGTDFFLLNITHVESPFLAAVTNANNIRWSQNKMDVHFWLELQCSHNFLCSWRIKLTSIRAEHQKTLLENTEHGETGGYHKSEITAALWRNAAGPAGLKANLRRKRFLRGNFNPCLNCNSTTKWTFAELKCTCSLWGSYFFHKQRVESVYFS